MTGRLVQRSCYAAACLLAAAACGAPAEGEAGGEEFQHIGPVLEGRLTGEDGAPVPGVRVLLYGGLATRWKVGDAVTGEDGRFRFDPCPAGSMLDGEKEGQWDYFLGLTLEGSELASADGRSWWDIRVPVVDRQVTRRDFVMVPGGALEGVVVDALSGEPTARSLRIYRSDEVRFFRYAESDAEGMFRASGLFPGHYVIDENSPERSYPVLGEVDVRATETTQCLLQAVPGRD